SMAAAVERALGARIADGLVVVKDGYTVPTERIVLKEAGHPVPDARGQAATEEMVRRGRPPRAPQLLLLLSSLSWPPPPRPPPARPPRPAGRGGGTRPPSCSPRAPPSTSSPPCASPCRSSGVGSSRGRPLPPCSSCSFFPTSSATRST